MLRWAVNHIAHQMCSRLSGNKDRTMITMAYTKMNIYEHVRFTLKIRLNTYEKTILTYINYISYIIYLQMLEISKKSDQKGEHKWCIFPCTKARRTSPLLRRWYSHHLTLLAGKRATTLSSPQLYVWMDGWVDGCMHVWDPMILSWHKNKQIAGSEMTNQLQRVKRSFWGTAEWMVHNGKSYKHGWFGGYPLVN